MEVEVQTDVAELSAVRQEDLKKDKLLEEMTFMKQQNETFKQQLTTERRRVEDSKKTIMRLLVEQSKVERKQVGLL